ncbi:MAG: 2-C-methyl-D-erythritol 4-phosphate cytidylyltransferase [Clostridia bacterium]|nr:2-C-methyl-D-erythritol 4-phosphate cytidylyltransferase [Clostridia bacterium]
MSSDVKKSPYNKFTRAMKKLFGVDHRDWFNSAIIVAAGAGTRMNLPDGQTKQMLCIEGVPVIVRTVLQFEACEDIDEIILVVRKDEFDEYRQFYKKYGFKKVRHIVAGGETRQASVLNGLCKVDKNADFVTIHDGVRCLITPGMISEVCTWAYHYGAATAVTRPVDTLKLSVDGVFIKETVDRDKIYHAQTPQIFKYDMYRAAALSAKKDGFEATDDNSLVERLKFKIYICDLGKENIKITTQEDVYCAEAILKSRGGDK